MDVSTYGGRRFHGGTYVVELSLKDEHTARGAIKLSLVAIHYTSVAIKTDT